jgi:hypothetical protein
MRLSSRRVLSLRPGEGQSIHVDLRKIKEKADAISLFDFSVQQPQPTPPDQAYRSRLFSAIPMCPLVARRSKTPGLLRDDKTAKNWQNKRAKL